MKDEQQAVMDQSPDLSPKQGQDNPLPAELEPFRSLSFEEAMIKLQEVTRALHEETRLQQLLELYREGMKLNQYCQYLLNCAEAEIQRLQQNETGGWETEDLAAHNSAY